MSEKLKRIMKTKDDKIIQLNQKIIHYRSELDRYKNLMIKRSTQNEVQLVNDEVEISSIVSDAQEDNHTLADENVNLAQEETDVINNKETISLPETIPPVLSYFHYVTFFNEAEEEGEKPGVNIYGNFIFQNITNRTFDEPILCYRVTPISKVQLGGKISFTNKQTEYLSDSAESWSYVHPDWQEWIREKGEHWLKPQHISELKPFEKGSFSNLNISFVPQDENKQFRVEGFLFARNQQDGIPAINSIALYI